MPKSTTIIQELVAVALHTATLNVPCVRVESVQAHCRGLSAEQVVVILNDLRFMGHVDTIEPGCGAIVYRLTGSGRKIVDLIATRSIDEAI